MNTNPTLLTLVLPKGYKIKVREVLRNMVSLESCVQLTVKLGYTVFDTWEGTELVIPEMIIEETGEKIPNVIIKKKEIDVWPLYVRLIVNFILWFLPKPVSEKIREVFVIELGNYTSDIMLKSIEK